MTPRFRSATRLRWPFALALGLVTTLLALHPWIIGGLGVGGMRLPYESAAWREPPRSAARVQRLASFLEQVSPAGKPASSVALLGGTVYDPDTDGCCLSLGRWPLCPFAPRRWLWIAADARGIVTGTELLSAPREPARREPERSPWRPIPLEVVARLPDFERDRFDGVAAVRLEGDEWHDGDAALYCRLKAEQSAERDDALAVEVVTTTGFSGYRLELRLGAREGAPALEGRATILGDIGPPSIDPLEDLHGLCAVEARGENEEAPLRLRVHLLGLASGQFYESADLKSVRADLELAWDPAWRGAWIDALRAPRSLDALAEHGVPRTLRVLRGAGNACTQDVTDPRAGELLAEGPVDGGGRRTGTWRTVYASGAPRTETEYARGLPSGAHRAWELDGSLQAEGRFADGLRDGVWRVRRYQGGMEDERWSRGVRQPERERADETSPERAR